jgi:choline dehydrogenase-like flavoprotein
MASKNYLELTNEVLIRLREPEASSVSDNAYVKLISKYINDSKRQVEDAYNWNSLSETLSAVTGADIFNYVLEGTGQRFRVIDVINDTSNYVMRNATTRWMDDMFLIANPAKGAPMYYNFNGTDTNGDTQVDLFPIPNGVYNLRFNVIRPQVELVANSDKLLVPHEPVILGALARAQAERGEDGGVQSAETYALFKQSLADAISLESARYVEEECWYSA